MCYPKDENHQAILGYKNGNTSFTIDTVSYKAALCDILLIALNGVMVFNSFG
jgi:hypothetical protein